MALSERAKAALEIALASTMEAPNSVAKEVADSAGRQAAVVAAIGTTTNLVGVDGTGSNAAPLAGTEARLDAIEAKVDALIAALKAASLMSSS